MAFQMGTAGLFAFTNTLSLIELGLYEEAAANMLKSKWATQTPARAKRLSEQMRTGNWVWKEKP
jgi:lysozyme